MNSAQLKRAKKEVRRRVRALRDSLSLEEMDRLSDLIADRLLDIPEVREAHTVMAFWSFGSEVRTSALIGRLHEDGVTIALPRIVGGELEAHRYAPGDPITVASFGAGEPSEGEPAPLDEIAVVLTPGIAFDRRGKRIGYGGGYYDRFLLRAPRSLRVGVCFDVQLVESWLPAGDFDLSVDLVVTESVTLRVPRDP